MKKSNHAVFYICQIPLSIFVFLFQDFIIREYERLGGNFFMTDIFMSIISVIPFIILMKENKYLKENHLGFGFMFFCVAVLLNYRGYDLQQKSFSWLGFHFVQVKYLSSSICNIIVYFLFNSISKRI